MKLEETELYIEYNQAMSALCILEDITNYENETISEAISKLQELDIKEIASKIYFTIDKD